MVCQAASQTRFRALKHENGVAGCATIIVRVIACFQPLQDCQAEYFRHLLKPDFESWLCGEEPDGLANAKSSKLPLDMGMQRVGIANPLPRTDKVSADFALPVFEFPELLNSKDCQVKQQSHGCYDTPDGGSGCAAKQFLVFDQTGDKTTLIYSSGIGTPFHCLNSWSTKPTVGYNLHGDEIGMTRDMHYPSGLNLTDDDCRGTDRSEMHEDTEEINALLYSDDEDDYPEDDEEISTGHSPSTMTAYDKQDWFQGGMEEVASSTRAAKRMKLSEGHYMIPSLMDTASSAKPEKLLAEDDDAESSSADETMRFGNMGSLSGNKRLRKEKIRQTVNILQGLIPDGENKDAIVILDEAIRYLRTLKLKAKSLGLTAL
ncbi:hypothetical protein Ancab_038316 [Ancistrocladus abbreviatus]